MYYYLLIILQIIFATSSLATGSSQFLGAQPSETCLKAFNEAILNHTNSYRNKHKSTALKVDTLLQISSQNYSNYLATNGLFEHSRLPGRGENLFYASGQKMSNNMITCQYTDNVNDCAAAGREAAEVWYGEVNRYDFAKPGFTSVTGHFTQIIWKSTTHMGCGLSIVSNTCITMVCCGYTPPGNVNTVAHFAANVAQTN